MPGPPVTGIADATPVAGSTPQSAHPAVVEHQGAVGQGTDPVGVDRGAGSSRPGARQRQHDERRPGGQASGAHRDPGEPVDPGVGDPDRRRGDDEVVEEGGAGHDDVRDHSTGRRGHGPHVPLGTQTAHGPDETRATVVAEAAQGPSRGPRQQDPWRTLHQIAGHDPAVGERSDVVGRSGARGDPLGTEPVRQGHRLGRPWNAGCRRGRRGGHRSECGAADESDGSAAREPGGIGRCG